MIMPETIINPDELKQLSYNDLNRFADSVRQFLIKTVSNTGGHIGANLGTVDLTIALHYVFDSPKDKFIWDTGHQGYTHKIITGRSHLFPSLNTYGGMNRFVTRTESEHDNIEASHAGTSISVALGIALAKKLRNEKRFVVAIIGDGALCEGLAWEALNHAAVEKDICLLIVLNDNGYAISPGFGALHEYLQSRNIGTDSGETLFTSLGLNYLGPVNGHNIEELVTAFRYAKQVVGVSLIHVKTIKGYGLESANSHPYRLHYSFPFDPSTGSLKDGTTSITYPDIAARVIGEEMERDNKVVTITPSTIYATGLQPIFNRFPDRCFDPGMEEQHAMTMTVGFALEGYKPIIFYQSTFMQRAFDQLIHDVCFMNLPILILTVRTGFSGYDNPTHHGIYDFAYLRSLPNLWILYPKDCYELERMVRDNINHLSGPTIIAMPYGPVDEFDSSVLNEPLESFLHAEEYSEGKDLLIITVGHKYGVARELILELSKYGIETGLVNLRYLKPLPEQQLLRLMSKVKNVVTIEEAVLDGGVGSAISTLAMDNGVGCEVLRIGIPCTFVEPGSNSELCHLYELDVKGIKRQIGARWPKWEIIKEL